MPQFSERKKLILTFLIINSEMHRLTEEEAMKYIKQNFGKDISRRTYYYYKKSIYENYEKSTLEDYGKHYSGIPVHHNLKRSGNNKGLVTLVMLLERISIIKKGLKLGINLVKYDRPINDFATQYTKNMESKCFVS
ncbi:MAG: hypothetical protein R2685_17355 [Candidatus Nitrosocosmicus sp.]|nr:hypothetical protein [Candidatus Nitrosocosmicus sp.]